MNSQHTITAKLGTGVYQSLLASLAAVTGVDGKDSDLVPKL
jgi:hypothetical protein